jgi:hypothetical protein
MTADRHVQRERHAERLAGAAIGVWLMVRTDMIDFWLQVEPQ